MNWTTNVTPKQLNYHHFPEFDYDGEALRTIPGYKALHRAINRVVRQRKRGLPVAKILDLGVGTGQTSLVVKKVFPEAHLTAIDFSSAMLEQARKRLGEDGIEYLLGDYASWSYPHDHFDIVLCVFGLHHQCADGKAFMIRRIQRMLKPGGLFILADLMTREDPHQAAYDEALHYAHMVRRASSPERLREWAHHHRCLNDLMTRENCARLLKQNGFESELVFEKHNTALFVAERSIALESKRRWKDSEQYPGNGFIERGCAIPQGDYNLPWQAYETYMRAQVVRGIPGKPGLIIVDFPPESAEDNKLHIHPISDRVITVIRGEGEFIAVRNGELVRYDIYPGTRVWMPRGVLHTFLAGKEGLVVESIHNLYVDFDDPQMLVYPKRSRWRI